MINLTNILRACDVGIAAFMETAWPMALPPRPDGADELAAREEQEEFSEAPDDIKYLYEEQAAVRVPPGWRGACVDREEQVRAEAFGEAMPRAVPGDGYLSGPKPKTGTPPRPRLFTTPPVEHAPPVTLGRQDLNNAAYVMGMYAEGHRCPAGGAGFWLELGQKFRDVVDAMP